MHTLKLLIADDDPAVRDSLSQAFSALPDFDVLSPAKDGLDAVAKAETLLPDAVILDLVMPFLDGFGVLSNIDFSKFKKRPVFIVLSNLKGELFINKALSLGADYFMLKPADTSSLADTIRELCAPVPSRSSDNASLPDISARKHRRSLDEKLANIFISVGIPAHIKGYQFLRESVKLAVERPDIVNSITKQLYPSVADIFHTSASKVERAIRHAIEVAWNRGKIENINNVFGIKIYSANDKPTNGEFIALLADKMMMESV